MLIINTKDKKKVRLIVGLHKYTFQNVCLEDNSIILNDEAQKIILNTKGITKDLSEELLEFLEYVENSTDDTVNHSKENLVKSIHKRVQEVKNDISMEVHILKKCEAQLRTYRTLLERDREKIEEGREEGREEGIKQLILKQYSKGLSIEYIADINEIDVEYVRDVVTNNTPKIK